MRTHLLCGLLLISAAAMADDYTIDAAHTSVVFKVNHMGFSNVYGMFSGAEGKFTIDDTKPEKSSVEFTIKADSVDTKDKKRDDHLRGPDFFNVKQFPTITFKSKSVKKLDATKFEVAGDLSLHGVTKPLTITFNRFSTGKDPGGKTRTGGETMFAVKRTDYNMTYMTGPGKVGDDIEMMVSLEGIKK